MWMQPRGELVTVRGAVAAVAAVFLLVSVWPLTVVSLPLAIVMCAWAVIWLWGIRQEWRYRAEVERYGRWPCPNCREPFGPGVKWGDPAKEWNTDMRGEPFTPHAIICCPHCRFLNCFDESGRPQFGRGILPTYERLEDEQGSWVEGVFDPPSPD